MADRDEQADAPQLRPAAPAAATAAGSQPDAQLLGRIRRHGSDASRRLRAWSGRPSGQLGVPALLLAALTALAGLGGAVVVPAAADKAEPTVPVPAAASADSAAPTMDAPSIDAVAPGTTAASPPSPPALTVAPSTPAAGPVTATPGGSRSPSAGMPGPVGPAGRPSDVVAGWAIEVGNRVGVPPVAMQAYGYAELVLAQTSPGCHLSWTTLAAIGMVESNHGRANGAALTPDGQALPQIIGLPLDGQGGRQRIVDTDRGQLDGDPVLDRAVGPMQFIPGTWRTAGTDADNDGANNPHDMDDAALAAARYLCGGGRDLATAPDWWAAILSYNDVRRYAQAVFDTANRYGAASRT